MTSQVLNDVRVRVHAHPTKPSAARRGLVEDLHENPPRMGREKVAMILNLEGKVPGSPTPRNLDPTLQTKGNRPLLLFFIVILT